MKRYARWLFSIAAIANFNAAAAIVFARPTLFGMLRLDSASATSVALADIVALFIAIFGYSYACIAYDAIAFRPYISLGAIGKLAFFATALWLSLDGIVSSALPSLAAGDVVFAILFLDYLRRSQRPARRPLAVESSR